MNLSHVLKCSVLGGLLLCSLGSSQALTLGRAQGAVLLGQPLDVNITVQLAADEDISQLCFEAVVFYGDNRQDASRTSVSTEGLRAEALGKVRVLVSAYINEPVVTLDLRSTCAYKTTRHYVLLADLASEVLALPVIRPLASVNVGAVPAPVKNVGPAQSPAPLTRSARLVTVLKAMRPTTPKTEPARLRLALLEPPSVLESGLKMSSELPFLSEDDAKKREASAVLWRALNVTPEDTLRDSARATAVESQIKLLQTQTATNQQLLAEMSTRLEKSRSQRYVNPLIYGLLIFLVVCGGTLAYGWRHWRLERAGGVHPWWRGNAAQGDAEGKKLEHADPERMQPQAPLAVVPTPSSVLPSSVTGVATVAADVDIELSGSVAQMPVTLTATTPTSGAHGHRDFAHSVLREISSQEILDACQQAEFFMTLGQYPEAITILERCIHESVEAIPLVYLDLLTVFHILSRKADFDVYRTEFNRRFTGAVPEFAEFNQDGHGLEDYIEVCAQIVALWPSQEAATYIAASLVRSGADDATEGFDLNAYRDLLLLHSVVKQIAPKTEGVDFLI